MNEKSSIGDVGKVKGAGSKPGISYTAQVSTSLVDATDSPPGRIVLALPFDFASPMASGEAVPPPWLFSNPCNNCILSCHSIQVPSLQGWWGFNLHQTVQTLCLFLSSNDSPK